mmetsp:Transcript_28322/g.57745  ORF Transcript_28322/g.57745 Transcript_28322/m.57745 type:complete len:506 (-) Transcript_28322:88-1605(-)
MEGEDSLSTSDVDDVSDGFDDEEGSDDGENEHDHDSISDSDTEWSEDEIQSHPIFTTRNDADPKIIYCSFEDRYGNELLTESEILDACSKMDFLQNEISCIPIGRWRSMVYIIRNCTRLDQVYLDYMELSVEIIESLFPRNCAFEFSLSVLSFVGSGLGRREIEVIVPFLECSARIDLLDLRKNRIGNEGAQILAEALDKIHVKSLILSDNGITSDGMSHILSSNSPTLTCLHVDRNEIGNDGIVILAQLFRQGSIALEELKIGRLNGFSVTWAKLLLESLHSNESMNELEIVGLKVADLPSLELLDNAAKKLVCDTSSFDAFCKSNHIFQGLVSREYKPSQTLKYAFRINTISDFSINDRLRCKLRSIYFHTNFDVEPFLSIKISIMPHVLGILSRSDEFITNVNEEGNLNGIYRFIRNWNVPDLCVFPSPELKIKTLEAENAKLLCSLNKLEGEVSRLQILQRESNQKIKQLKMENQRLLEENEEHRVRKGDKSIKRSNVNTV